MTEEMKQAICDWLKTESGLTIVEANQSKPRPNPPYLSFTFAVAGARVGTMDHISVDQPGGSNFKLSGLRIGMISINIFGNGANDKMALLRDTLDKPETIEAFDLEGIAVFEENGPNDLTELLEKNYEERSQMDISFYYSKDTELNTAYIDEVEVTVEVNEREETFEVKKN